MLQVVRSLAVRLIFYLARTAATGVASVANRLKFTVSLPTLEVLVTFRRVTEPDGWTREEIVTMLETVRAAERRLSWRAPDSGGPKAGKMRCDGEELDVLYWGAYPTLDALTPEFADSVRLVVSVDAEGTSRVLRDRPLVRRE